MRGGGAKTPDNQWDFDMEQPSFNFYVSAADAATKTAVGSLTPAAPGNVGTWHKSGEFFTRRREGMRTGGAVGSRWSNPASEGLRPHPPSCRDLLLLTTLFMASHHPSVMTASADTYSCDKVFADAMAAKKVSLQAARVRGWHTHY